MAVAVDAVGAAVVAVVVGAAAVVVVVAAAEDRHRRCGPPPNVTTCSAWRGPCLQAAAVAVVAEGAALAATPAGTGTATWRRGGGHRSPRTHLW